MASGRPGCSQAMTARLKGKSIFPKTAGIPGYADYVGIHMPESMGARAAEIAQLDGLRQRLGCSQAKLAELIGVSQSSLSRLFRMADGGQSRRRGGSSLATRGGLARIELALSMFGSLRSPESSPKPTHRLIRGEVFTQPVRIANSSAASLVSYSEVALADRGMPCTSHKVAAETRATYRVLVAEDDPETAVLYNMLFTQEENRLHYEVAAAPTAAECLQELRTTWKKRPYDLLLLDLGLGVRQGSSRKSLLDRLRQRPLWVPSHLLVVSGMSPYHVRSAFGDLAKFCAAFLAKPFDIDVLLDSAYTLVTGKSLGSPYLQYF